LQPERQRPALKAPEWGRSQPGLQGRAIGSPPSPVDEARPIAERKGLLDFHQRPKAAPSRQVQRLVKTRHALARQARIERSARDQPPDRGQIVTGETARTIGSAVHCQIGERCRAPQSARRRSRPPPGSAVFAMAASMFSGAPTATARAAPCIWSRLQIGMPRLCQFRQCHPIVAGLSTSANHNCNQGSHPDHRYRSD